MDAQDSLRRAARAHEASARQAHDAEEAHHRAAESRRRRDVADYEFAASLARAFVKAMREAGSPGAQRIRHAKLFGPKRYWVIFDVHIGDHGYNRLEVRDDGSLSAAVGSDLLRDRERLTSEFGKLLAYHQVEI